MSPPLSKKLYEELGASCRGQVYLRDDPGYYYYAKTRFFLCSNLTLISSSFADYSTIFNGNVVTMAKAVVCPLDAEDVSKYAFSRFSPEWHQF